MESWVFAPHHTGETAIGLYGLISYSEKQRTQAIGIRLTLGVVPCGVLGLALRQSAAVALAWPAQATTFIPRASLRRVH